MLGERSTGDWRPDLWQRCSALQARVYHRAGGTKLTADELDDVWTELIVKFARSPGSSGALPAEVDGWSDSQLVPYLATALQRASGKAVRGLQTAGGESRFASTPLEELGEEVLVRGSIWQDAVPADPAKQVLQGAEVRRLVGEVHDVVDLEAAQLVLAEASGAPASEQRRLLGITRRRLRTVQDRVDFAQAVLRERTYGVLAWLLPESVLRWLVALGSSGTVPRLGAAGVALTAVLAGGAGVASRNERAAAPQVRPALSSQANASRKPAVIAVTEQASSVTAAKVRTQVAARKTARARQRRAQRHRRPTQSAPPSAARREFTPQPSQPSQRTPAAAASPSAATSRASTASQEFEPTGR